LERARELRHLRRARLRNHSTNDSALTDASSFLPLHQREAIDAFFDRVGRVRADVRECQIYLERYHGMHLRRLECDRCHREVSFHSVFLFFVQHVLQRGHHRYGVANDADPGVIPDELLPALDGLTQMEEMLCSLASPCFLMWVSKGGQYKTRGNVITFPQDIASLCSTLPRLPETLDVLLVRKPNARSPNGYKDFRVRKKKVLAFLRFLKKHNPYYADVVICPSDLVDLPADSDISDRLPHVEASSAPTGSDLNTVDRLTAPASEDLPAFQPDCLSEEDRRGPSEMLRRAY
jgi:hypothetical protein